MIYSILYHSLFVAARMMYILDSSRQKECINVATQLSEDMQGVNPQVSPQADCTNMLTHARAMVRIFVGRGVVKLQALRFNVKNQTFMLKIG